MLRNVEDTFQTNLKFAVVAQEKHADGEDHLHVMVALESQVDYRSSDCLDHLASKHGNYQGCRSVAKTIRYIVKDGEYVSKGVDVSKYLDAKKKKQSPATAFVAQDIQDGVKLEDLYLKYPTLMMDRGRRVEHYYHRMKEFRIKALTQPTKTPLRS